LVDVGINEVKIATDKLNSRPRKYLRFKTPRQVFFEMTGIDARQLGIVYL
jgi:IS30 family transposase